MAASDFKRLMVVIKKACSVYGRAFSEDMAGAYSEILDGEDIEAVERRAAMHFRNSRFFPSPADLLGNGDDGDLRLNAVTDWLAVHKGGGLAHPAAAKEVYNLLGGYRARSEEMLAQSAFNRKEFVELYVAAVKRIDAKDAAARLDAAQTKGLPS